MVGVVATKNDLNIYCGNGNNNNNDNSNNDMNKDKTNPNMLCSFRSCSSPANFRTVAIVAESFLWLSR